MVTSTATGDDLEVCADHAYVGTNPGPIGPTYDAATGITLYL